MTSFPTTCESNSTFCFHSPPKEGSSRGKKRSSNSPFLEQFSETNRDEDPEFKRDCSEIQERRMHPDT
ncbi:hypothetical protein CDAR_611451 [Caerostris darwini]|uniref:Uncharacterized protein n=1 Tax=Caerostris darwini TaxID=1538125 RepID=A0AAV4UQD1_9ARAC|nr:hypothetical protein CDAR_611451 [Caerostris darwini]